MAASMIFCGDPLGPARVDPHFREQADAVRAMATAALVDHDELIRGDARRAVRRVPQDLGPCWYRGWMMPSAKYADLAEALAGRGNQLLTRPAEYQRAHELPGWYEIFAAVTPKSVWMKTNPYEVPTKEMLAELTQKLNGGAAIVKDYVKSRKQEWADACYVPDLTDLGALHTVVSNVVDRQGEDLAGGIVIREFEEFTTNGPDAGEARVWWLDGEVILIGPHPDSPEKLPAPDLSDIQPLVKALGCRFVTTDLARHSDGRWRVVEAGDGQVSDLPRTVAPALLAEALTSA
jgi:hypothetical protein